VLVVEIADPQSILGTPRPELTEWCPGMQVTRAGETLQASEIERRPARPHLANTGMEDYFPPERDPLRGRGIGTAVAARGRRILIAAAVTTTGDPAAAALASWKRRPPSPPTRCAPNSAPGGGTTGGDPRFF